MAKVAKSAWGTGTASDVPATVAVDPAVLERAAEETTRMGRSDRVFHWDKRQGAQVWADAEGNILTPEQLGADELITALLRDEDLSGSLNRHHLVRSPDVLVCGHDKSHGPLIINGSGSVLLCCATKRGAACTYNVPVSV